MFLVDLRRAEQRHTLDVARAPVVHRLLHAGDHGLRGPPHLLQQDGDHVRLAAHERHPQARADDADAVERLRGGRGRLDADRARALDRSCWPSACRCSARTCRRQAAGHPGHARARRAAFTTLGIAASRLIGKPENGVGLLGRHAADGLHLEHLVSDGRRAGVDPGRRQGAAAAPAGRRPAGRVRPALRGHGILWRDLLPLAIWTVVGALMLRLLSARQAGLATHDGTTPRQPARRRHWPGSSGRRRRRRALISLMWLLSLAGIADPVPQYPTRRRSRGRRGRVRRGLPGRVRSPPPADPREIVTAAVAWRSSRRADARRQPELVAAVRLRGDLRACACRGARRGRDLVCTAFGRGDDVVDGRRGPTLR